MHACHEAIATLDSYCSARVQPRHCVTWFDGDVPLAATTLCAFHYIVCTLSIWLTQALGGVKSVKLPFNGKQRLYSCV